MVFDCKPRRNPGLGCSDLVRQQPFHFLRRLNCTIRSGNRQMQSPVLTFPRKARIPYDDTKPLTHLPFMNSEPAIGNGTPCSLSVGVGCRVILISATLTPIPRRHATVNAMIPNRWRRAARPQTITSQNPRLITAKMPMSVTMCVQPNEKREAPPDSDSREPETLAAKRRGDRRLPPRTD
jgi:hypothetical protein